MSGLLHRFNTLFLVACALTAVAAGSLVGAASTSTGPFTPQQRGYWAFQKVIRPNAPATANQNWTANPIDAFVLRKLEAKGIEPSPPADKITLIRRASFDLIGLPPTPEEVRAFLVDESPRAFESVIDRLLASPHYGERWGRHWLDLARFAESTGFEQDVTRPNAWRYRDYVINAFNSDKPYDRFVQEQIAGDELWPDSFEARIATAFNRHYAQEGNQKDLLLARQETLADITNVVGSTFLGLTFGCAQCHDHKFDPILQKDYYRLKAFFANVDHDDRFPVVPHDQLQEYERKLAAWEEKTQAIWDEMSALLMPQRAYTPDQLLARYPDHVIDAMKKPESDRTPIQRWMAHLLGTKDCGTCPLKPKPYLDPSFRSVAKKLKGEDKKRFEELEAELEKFAHLKPKDIDRGIGMIDVNDNPPPTHVLGGGLYTNPGEEVQPGFLSILDPGTARIEKPAHLPSTGRRTALAKWLTDLENPLTGRVMVNRIWHHHFGKGIVATPGDFGVMGERPTHPELLDWLTAEFVESGWSLKHMHRLIMTSNTYQQSSEVAGQEQSPVVWSPDRKGGVGDGAPHPAATKLPVSIAAGPRKRGVSDLPKSVSATSTAADPDSANLHQKAVEADPFNRLLWRFPPQRLEAEVVRDSLLAVSGLLNPAVGGPSVFPPLPPGMPKPVGGWELTEEQTDQHRRSIYIFVRRNNRYPMLDAFDFPDSHESCARRNQTTTAPQALTLLNSGLTAKWARAFAGRVLDEAGGDKSRQVESAYRLAYSRDPDPWEKDTALTFFEHQRKIILNQLAKGKKPVVPETLPAGVEHEQAAALVDYCLMLLNSNEFVYRF